MDDLVIPADVFILCFDDMEEFTVWARSNDFYLLEDLIRDFEKCELYEHCAILRDIKEEKLDEMLKGFGIE